MTEDLRARMMSLNLPSAAAPGPPGGGGGGGNNSDLSPDFGFSSVSSTPAGSLSARPSRPRPSLNMSGHMSDSGLTPSSSTKTPRRPPGSLIFGSSISSSGPMSGGIPDRNNFNSGNQPQSSVVEQERKLNEIMNQNGLLQLNGVRVKTSIDDLELLGDLGNGTCGHVVKMRVRTSGQEIAVKQMRRTGNSDETKRIIMDLDVVLKSIDCRHIVVCLGCFITASDVWICMELMSTCFDKLLKHLKQPIPEQICGKVAVSTLKALNYLKEYHGVIHRDVKPSNILLDSAGNIKLCDFGISGRLVDSKAKTRSAGCAAYMAPERIDPPNPSKPDYDIRADVWSLGITLVELATGHFPYRDCKTDFEVLTKVLQDDPPLLPTKKGFSIEFCSFVRDCLMKNYKDRPKYRKLLQHPFIQRYEKEVVDVGAWYRSHMNTADGVSPNNNTAAAAASTSNATNSQQQQLSQNTTTPSSNATTTPGSASSSAMNPSPLGNQDSLDSPSSFLSPSATSQSTDHSFKPMPSPRVTRSWRPPAKIPSPTSAAATAQTAAYPSAIGDRHHHHSPQEFSLSPRERQHENSQRRPSFEYLRQQQHQQHQQPQYPHFDLYQPSPMAHRSTSARDKASSGGSSGYCSTPYLGQTAIGSSRTTATSGPSSLQDEHLTRPTTARYATAQGPSFDRSVTSGYSRADPSARGAPKKFEFTFPNSNLPPSGSERAGSSSTSPSYHHSAADSLYHQYRTGLSYNTG